MSTTSTLDQIHQRVIKELWPGRYPLIETTTGAGSTSQLVIASAAYSSASVNAYDNAMVYCPSVTAAPKWSRVTRGGYTVASGTFAMSPVYGSSPGSGVSAYFLYGLHINDLDESINDLVRTLYLPRYLVLSLCADPNMESADAAATDWPDADGAPTQTKETSIVLTGKQSLKIVTTVVDTSVRSPSIPVTEFETLLLSVPVKVTAGSLRVQLYDVTNSAEVSNGGVTVDEEAWTEVRFPALSVPSNCQNVQVRFIAKTAATTAYVDHVSLLSAQRSIYALPSQVASAVDVEGVYYLPAGQTSEATNAYGALAEELQPWPYNQDGLRDYAGVNSHRITVDQPMGYPLFVMFKAKDSTLAQNTSDTNTTVAPQDLVVFGAVADCAERLYRKTESSHWLKIRNEARVRYSGLLDAEDLLRPKTRPRIQKRVSIV